MKAGAEISVEMCARAQSRDLCGRACESRSGGICQDMHDSWSRDLRGNARKSLSGVRDKGVCEAYLVGALHQEEQVPSQPAPSLSALCTQAGGEEKK